MADANDGYSSARAAADAIIQNNQPEMIRSIFDDLSEDGTEAGVELDWKAAADAIAADPLSLGDDAALYWGLLAALSETDQVDPVATIRAALEIWADAHWGLISEKARDKAIKAARLLRFVSERDFEAIVARWPRLAADDGVLESLIGDLEADSALLDLTLARLSLLKGDHQSVLRVLNRIVRSNRVLTNDGDLVCALIDAWARPGVWSQVHRGLWTKTDVAISAAEAVPEHVANVVALLREFDLVVAEGNDFDLSRMSAETRAAWRTDLRRAVGDDDELRRAAAEAILWYAPSHVDRAAVFAVAELYRHESADLSWFVSHVAPLVRRRAAAVISLLEGSTDAGRLHVARRPVRQPRDAPPSASATWIGNHQIETMLRQAIDEAAAELADEVRDTRSSGEETLVALLFDRLRGALRAVSHTLEMLAAEQDANQLLQFRLEHRFVGKSEEGASGIGSRRFSTDVCVIFKACEAGRPFARRASLVQAKRLHVKGSGLEPDYYPVDRTQIEDIAEQTSSSFMLLVGPRHDGITMPTIPAQLFLDMVERGSPSSFITPAAGARLGKSIADWLLFDVIGLWSGDHRQAVVEKAEGRDGAKPFLMVEVIADRIPRGPDGWTGRGMADR